MLLGDQESQWVDQLRVLQSQSSQYQTHAKDVVASLTSLNTDLSTDAGNFSQIVNDLNTAVNGDNGVLKQIKGELSDIQGKIDGAIAGIALSGLAIVGGVFLAAVGGVADFVTAGTTTPLVVAGIGIVAAGVGGEVASAITLKNLNDQKAHLLKQKDSLKAEVHLAQGISSGYQSLSTQLGNAITAAQGMANAWNSIDSDLGSLVSDLQNGVTNAGAARTLFLTAANSVVKTVVADISTIKTQMAGVNTISVPAGETVGDALVAAAKKAA